MIELFKSQYLLPTKEFRCLSMLLAIHHFPKSSQNALGKMTHLSSSMVNNYIKDLKGKHLIYSAGSTNRSQSYHLTEKGKNELSNLFFSYSAEIVQMYSAIKLEIKKVLSIYHERGIRNVILFGASETAEIVYTVLKGLEFSVVGVVDSDQSKVGKKFNGCIIKNPSDIPEIEFDAIVISSFGKQEEILNFLKDHIGIACEIIRLANLSLG